jgi:ribonuclease R
VHCSQRERRAEEAERDVDERYKCAWMEQHVGSEFDGVVTGVTSFGLFVELDDSKVSGLVHISQLANDYYHFDPARKLLQGERTGGMFRLGDHVRVQVLRASLEDRKIDFRLVSLIERSGPAAKKAAAAPVPGRRGSRKTGGASRGDNRAPVQAPAPAPVAAPVQAPAPVRQSFASRLAKAAGRAFGKAKAAAGKGKRGQSSAGETESGSGKAAKGKGKQGK